MSSTRASLHDRIDRTLARHPDLADARSLAQHVVDEIPDADLRSLLTYAQIAKVTRVLDGRRRDVERDLPARADTPELSDQRVQVRPGKWKFLRDCKPHDLRHMAAWLRAMADGHLASAERYEAMADSREAALRRRDGLEQGAA